MFEAVEALATRYEEMKAQLGSEGQATVKAVFHTFFTTYPNVAAVRWTQYTPHFNDGDPCTFSVGEAQMRFEGDENWLDSWSLSSHANGRLTRLLQGRTEEFFEEEVDKLERWAEDVKFALERELRELDTLIKAAKKTSKSAVALAEKLEAQKQIKTLEAKRNNKRRQLFEAQDDVDRKRAELIEEIERQLQTKTSIKPVFTLRWTLGDGAGTTA